MIKRAFERYHLQSDTVFYDTTNFYTYIATTNQQCQIAQRGKNKQKRTDLRQFGLALVVTREDMVPLYHQTYQGNMNDSKVFKSLFVNITQRVGQLGLKISDHTFVFDWGNNSEKNLSLVDGLGIAYVGALTPYQHKQLVEMAREGFEKTRVDDLELDCYRTKTQIWGQDRTVVVFLSDRLKSGQIRGLYQQLEKAEKQEYNQ